MSVEQYSDDVIIIETGKRITVLKVLDEDQEIDAEDILNIDYSNIIGEVLTFSVILNRIANLKAEINNTYSNAKLDLEIKEAQLSEKFRKELTEDILDKNGNFLKKDKPTVKEVENKVITDEEFIAMRREVFKLEKQQSYLESLYWAAQDKSKKLDKLGSSIKPDDFDKEIITGAVNGIMIKSIKK